MSSATTTLEHFINGAFVRSTGQAIPVINPSTEHVIAEVPDAGAMLVDQAVAAARASQFSWELLPAIERAGYLKKIAATIREKLPEIAEIITLEQGKVAPLAQMEVFLAAEYIDYMAEWARRLEGEIVSSDRPGEDIYIYRRALGVVAGILPWNFPFFMIARKFAPALVTGNTIVIKPSEETPLCANAFANIVADAGIPDGVINIVYGAGNTTGVALSGHKDVDMVSFTGSTLAGSKIYQQAAANITKVSLELGGKAPVIVMDDADIDLAVATLRGSKTINTGQACHCPERIYVHEKVKGVFTEKLCAAMNAIQYGGFDAEMGPLVNAGAITKLDALIADAQTKGANLLCGGTRNTNLQGYHFQPTVIADTTADMHIMSQEIFGPVLVVNGVADLDEAIQQANNSEFGLSSSIFTASLSNAKRAIKELNAGETYINRENFEAIQGFHAGIKKSGIGGADGKHGLYEFMSTQVVYW